MFLPALMVSMNFLFFMMFRQFQMAGLNHQTMASETEIRSILFRDSSPTQFKAKFGQVSARCANGRRLPVRARHAKDQQASIVMILKGGFRITMSRSATHKFPRNLFPQVARERRDLREKIHFGSWRVTMGTYPISSPAGGVTSIAGSRSASGPLAGGAR